MLFGLYLGTTIASWLLTGISYNSIQSRMKRENYRFNKSVGEKIKDYAQTGIIMLVPLLNLCVGLVLLFKADEMYDEVIEENLIKRNIEKFNPDEVIEEENRISEEERLRKIQEKIKKEKEKKAKSQMNKPQAYGSSYSEMTPVEKLEFLEAEREALLRQIENDSKKEKEVPVKKIGTRREKN